MKRVLILCTGNSCRSQMAEVIWNELAQGQWQAHSAGSEPAGFVHPLAKRVLAELNYPVDRLTSKASDEFASERFDLVVTVCDNAQKACPVWPNAEKTLHWPVPDPATASGDETEQLKIFRQVRDQILSKIGEFLETTVEK